MAESGNKIYIAANEGLYFKTDLSLSAVLPADPKPTIVIAQNPLKNSAFILESSIPVDEILIYTMAGQLLSTQKHSAYQYNFELPCSGIYVIKAMIGNAVQNFKVVAGS